MRTIKHNLGDKSGDFAISYQLESDVKRLTKANAPKREAKFRDVFMAFPADSEALNDWHKSKTYKVKGLDESGSEVEITFSGVEAAAAAKCMHDIETVRGKAREKLASGITPDAVGRWLREKMAVWTPQAKLEVVVKTVSVNANELNEILAIEDISERTRRMAEYLVKAGASVNDAAPAEPSEEEKESEIEREARLMAEAVDRKLEEAAAQQ